MADALFLWVAGGVWRHEQQRSRERNFTFSGRHLYEEIADFLDAFNTFDCFDENKAGFEMEMVQRRARRKGIQLGKVEWIERPPWLSENVLKGKYGERS